MPRQTLKRQSAVLERQIVRMEAAEQSAEEAKKLIQIHIGIWRGILTTAGGIGLYYAGKEINNTFQNTSLKDGTVTGLTAACMIPMVGCTCLCSCVILSGLLGCITTAAQRELIEPCLLRLSALRASQAEDKKHDIEIAEPVPATITI